MRTATDPSRLGWLSPFTFGTQLISPTPPHNPSPRTTWDFHGWSSYTSTTGYHEPQNGISDAPYSLLRGDAPTRRSTTHSSKDNVPHAINFRALCDANLVTLRSKFRLNETRVLPRMVGGGARFIKLKITTASQDGVGLSGGGSKVYQVEKHDSH